MEGQTPEVPWFGSERSAWEVDVLAWLEWAGFAGDLGPILSANTIKERPWSVVQRISFRAGETFFKACAAPGGFEPGLLLWLAERWPRMLPEICASELDQAWILTADAGKTMPEGIDLRPHIDALARILARYAEIQIESLSAVEPLLGLGLSDRRLERLPERLERLIGEEIVGAGREAVAAERIRTEVRKALPTFALLCHELADSGYAAGLDHGDLHLGNLYWRKGVARLGDWGDACITHPFCSIAVTMEAILPQIQSEVRLARAMTLRDAYLRPWASFGKERKLRRDFGKAMSIAQIVRALSFAHMFQGAGPEHLDRWLPLIPDRLESWLERHVDEAGEDYWVEALVM